MTRTFSASPPSAPSDPPPEPQEASRTRGSRERRTEDRGGLMAWRPFAEHLGRVAQDTDPWALREESETVLREGLSSGGQDVEVDHQVVQDRADQHQRVPHLVEAEDARPRVGLLDDED